MLYSELLQRIESSKELDFGQIFNDSIELFKKIWLQGFITVLLSFALMIPFFIIFYAPLVVVGIADASNPEDFSGLEPVAFIFMLLAYLLLLFAIMVITVGLRAALFRIMANRDHDNLSKDDYFFYLRKPYLSKTITVGLAYLVISLIAALLCFFPIIYAFVPLNLLMVVYAFNPEMSTGELVNASFKLGNKKWLITFGLLIVTSILAQMVGFLLCGIGILLTSSFSAVPLYYIYKGSIGIEKNTQSDLEQIGQNSEPDATI